MTHGPPATTTLVCRRYRCMSCGAVLLVVPRGVAPHKHYGYAAIAMALTLSGRGMNRGMPRWCSKGWFSVLP
jgi:hypothetical protein